MINYIKYLILVSIFLGCTNRYEINARGHYKISYIEKKGIVDHTENKDESILFLKSNNEFSLLFRNKTIIGKWEADDNGDITWIKLVSKNGIETNGQIGDSIIIFNSPLTLFSGDITKIIYHKIR